jgi:hypothetical protein
LDVEITNLYIIRIKKLGVMNMEKSEAVAYTTIAMKKLGYDQAEIERVTNIMVAEFEEYTKEVAENRADKILFHDE